MAPAQTLWIPQCVGRPLNWAMCTNLAPQWCNVARWRSILGSTPSARNAAAIITRSPCNSFSRIRSTLGNFHHVFLHKSAPVRSIIDRCRMLAAFSPRSSQPCTPATLLIRFGAISRHYISSTYSCSKRWVMCHTCNYSSTKMVLWGPSPAQVAPTRPVKLCSRHSLRKICSTRGFAHSKNHIRRLHRYANNFIFHRRPQISAFQARL